MNVRFARTAEVLPGAIVYGVAAAPRISHGDEMTVPDLASINTDGSSFEPHQLFVRSIDSAPSGLYTTVAPVLSL